MGLKPSSFNYQPRDSKNKSLHISKAIYFKFMKYMCENGE